MKWSGRQSFYPICIPFWLSCFPSPLLPFLAAVVCFPLTLLSSQLLLLCSSTLTLFFKPSLAFFFHQLPTFSSVVFSLSLFINFFINFRSIPLCCVFLISFINFSTSFPPFPLSIVIHFLLLIIISSPSFYFSLVLFLSYC